MPGRTYLFPNLSILITFAAAPLVLTPCVRNQRVAVAVELYVNTMICTTVSMIVIVPFMYTLMPCCIVLLLLLLLLVLLCLVLVVLMFLFKCIISSSICMCVCIYIYIYIHKVYVCVCMYVYIYIYIYPGGPHGQELESLHPHGLWLRDNDGNDHNDNDYSNT